MTTPDSFDNPSPQLNLVGDHDESRAGRGSHDDTLARDSEGMLSTAPPVEHAILVGVDIGISPSLLPLEDSLAELSLLAKTADLEIAGMLTQNLAKPHPATLIGRGKLEELKMLVAETGANVVIFDDELSPRQQRELERALGENFKVIDRTALILDIFARHASTREGSVQVELAQYEYRLPRLTRAWTHLARQAGGRAGGASGGVGVRGPGETQLEVDRREIGRRISFLKEQLEQIRKHRRQYRRRRYHSTVPVVALVGYTNAGKSTLLNALSGAGVLAEDQLFATLDPTTRRVELASGRNVLLTDTVGFIQKLPTTLVAAFRATLEEVNDANLLVHVVDVSHPNMEEQIAAVEEVLEELGAGQKTVVTALNKIDRLDTDSPEAQTLLMDALAEYPNAVAFSAMTGESLDVLAGTIARVLQEQMAPVDALIPYAEAQLTALFHEHGVVQSEEHTDEGTHIIGRLPSELLGRFEAFLTRETT